MAIRAYRRGPGNKPPIHMVVAHYRRINRRRDDKFAKKIFKYIFLINKKNIKIKKFLAAGPACQLPGPSLTGPSLAVRARPILSPADAPGDPGRSCSRPPIVTAQHDPSKQRFPPLSSSRRCRSLPQFVKRSPSQRFALLAPFPGGTRHPPRAPIPTTARKALPAAAGTGWSLRWVSTTGRAHPDAASRLLLLVDRDRVVGSCCRAAPHVGRSS